MAGDRDIEAGTIGVKDLSTGEQVDVAADAVLADVLSRLANSWSLPPRAVRVCADTPLISGQQRSLGEELCMLSQMNAPPEPRTLADTGGLIVTDDGRRVLVIDRCTGALATLAFVLGVITLVVAGFGAVALATSMPSRALGAIFLAVGLVFALLTFLVVRKIRRRRSQPLHECRP